ncbi:class I SAM-dependent methyltransferase [Nitriliruptor alkaliphilus]|uniref:class I SAM-dependent methyltransferase n=1 Tax=Nitriliruptor alkaliphilus TaxID=427918 RepID=UPI000698D747|nr:class I SAM-dependent methyltransferase [Nitriliruptor alkaliphilus]
MAAPDRSVENGAEDDPRARWNARHRERVRDATDPAEPATFLTERADLLPEGGRALDVAGGTGRNALWLAGRGLDVTLVDVSDTACAEATARAVATGISLDVVRADLTVDPVPAGPWDVIVVHHFLDRDLWRRLPSHLAAGGLLFACQATVTNLERHGRPGRRWLLDDGEVATLAADLRAADPDLEVLEMTEGWTAEGRHEARLVLRRRG